MATERIRGGVASLALVGLLVGGALVGLLGESASDPWSAWAALDPYMARVAGFTLWQALLSTLVSVVPGLVLARAMSRRPHFPGRALLVRLFALPLALPAIVAALGLLEVFGRAGYLAPLLTAATGRAWDGIYGLSGILIAHAFFNVPLAARLFLQALNTVGADQWRLASQLGMAPAAQFRFIEWPVLRAALPGVAGLIFMLCVTSFTLVLTLGGGPAATTLEVAIYQALRFDFDPARAVALTLLQIVLALLAVLAMRRLGADATPDPNLALSAERQPVTGALAAAADAAVIAAGALFVAAPLAAIVASGLKADLARLAAEPAVRDAAALSLGLAAGAALLAVALAFGLVTARHVAAARSGRHRLAALFDAGAGFVLVVPPIVVGAGWFVLLRTIMDPLAAAPFMVVAVNAVMAMPFAVRALRPAHDDAAARNDRLCEALGIRGWTRLRLIDGPELRAPLGMAFAFSMALSLGDLGVIALFGSDSVRTLPYLLLARMGSYRTADAAGIALLLGLLCLILMVVADRLGRSMRR